MTYEMPPAGFYEDLNDFAPLQPEPKTVTLKPCPFCGGKAELKNAMNSLRYIECYSPYVSCGRCHASMFGVMTTAFFKATPEQVREGLTKLFKKWNTRA